MIPSLHADQPTTIQLILLFLDTSGAIVVTVALTDSLVCTGNSSGVMRLSHSLNCANGSRRTFKLTN